MMKDKGKNCLTHTQTLTHTLSAVARFARHILLRCTFLIISFVVLVISKEVECWQLTQKCYRTVAVQF